MRAEGGEGEKKTFDCCDCGKKYSFLHKLQHHQTWSCKKEKEGETCMLSSPRRIGSQNCFFLPPTPEKCENGDVEYEGESNSKEVFFCDVCERSFLSKNARKKHKKKEHKVGVASERVSKPCDEVESAGTVASERVSKPHDEVQGAETIASERVSKPHDEVEGAGKRKCEEVCEEDEYKAARIDG